MIIFSNAQIYEKTFNQLDKIAIKNYHDIFTIYTQPVHREIKKKNFTYYPCSIINININIHEIH